MQEDKFSFIGSIEEYEGIFRLYAIFLPATILSKLPQKGRYRTKGTMNGIPFNLAVLSAKEKGKYFMISSLFKKQLNANIGEPIPIEFTLASYTDLEIPEELLSALEQDEEANDLFKAFTIGIQRSLVHYVSSAKSIETRIKRSLELLHKIKTKQLSIQKNTKKTDK